MSVRVDRCRALGDLCCIDPVTFTVELERIAWLDASSRFTLVSVAVTFDLAEQKGVTQNGILLSE